MLIEFKSKELTVFQDKIEKESLNLINKIIKKHCPISVGEKIKALYGEEAEWLIVTEISLMAVDSWGWHGEKLSFKYEGLPLKKNGEPMKNRKPKWFGCFEKNGKICHTPSYSRLSIMSANMCSRE
jgi:hypothetical protein